MDLKMEFSIGWLIVMLRDLHQWNMNLSDKRIEASKVLFLKLKIATVYLHDKY